MIFKIFLVLFAVFAIVKTVRQYRQKKASLYWLSLWTFFWAVVIFVAFLPQTTDLVARYVGIGRGADLVVYTAVLFLFYGFYSLMVAQERMKQEMTQLVRHLAMVEAKKGKKYDATE